MELVEAHTTVEDLDAFLDQLRAIGEEHDVTVQAFDARYVTGRAHLERAVALADRAIARDEAIARDRAMEILLYAAGRRQINRALEMGVDEGVCPSVILVDDPAADGDRPARAGGDPEAASSEASDQASGDPETDGEAAAAAAVRALESVTLTGTLGEYDPEWVREFFDVSEAELEVTDGDLAALVGERVALLTVEK